MKKVAILQSNYIPWKGYFDIINMVDEFILYDDMQYTRRDWRNRNKIKTLNGTQWLTIPVENKGKFFQKINETRVVDNKWVDSHWKSIQCNYARAKYFEEYEDRIKQVYTACKDEEYLSQINYRFILEICSILGIKTKITWSSDYNLVDGKTERLVGLVKEAGGNCYLSGPAAKDYIIEDLFKNEGIQLEWMDYSNYKEYQQISKPFEHGVSILDLIFNEGISATKYMKSF
ncbi:MAG: WbqC family protein [Lachnospiraceae bacterium]|nr:WbqC family protein [Lachnospiraceae bacterium]